MDSKFNKYRKQLQKMQHALREYITGQSFKKKNQTNNSTYDTVCKLMSEAADHCWAQQAPVSALSIS